MDADIDVPEAVRMLAPVHLAVWRKGLQPHFKTRETGEAVFMRMLLQDYSIANVAGAPKSTEHLSDPMTLARWLGEWWEDGFLGTS